MFHAKAVNCCGDVVALLDAGPDGGACPAAGDCRGFNGTCADLTTQFADVPVLPSFPAGLQDYTCHAFPDDDAPLDSFIVGLISIAIALPVAVFLASCFETANDGEAPESWLEWGSWRKLVFGVNAHRRWHYTGPAGPPNRHVRWFCRSMNEPPTETAVNLVHSLAACATRSDPPWIAVAARVAGGKERGTEPTEEDCGDDNLFSTDTEMCELRRRRKRAMPAAGLAGVLVCWVVFTWFIFVYGACGAGSDDASCVRVRPSSGAALIRSPAFRSPGWPV
jgi:hypothetical protein